MFATLLALYPHKSSEEIAQQLGMSERHVMEIASIFGIKKCKKYRSDVNRKNGEHPNKGHQPGAKPVEKVARNGRVVATYRSTVEAADANGISRIVMSNTCKNKIHKYRDGYLYRYKEL